MKVKKLVIWSIIVLIVLTLLWTFKIVRHYPRNINLDSAPADFFGVTFSDKFADELGVSWREAYLATIDDLEVKYIRLPIYWDEVQAETKGSYDFSRYDYMLNQGKLRKVKFIVSIGFRLPRWPECHVPDWAQNLNENERQQAVLDYLQTVVNRYKDREDIIYWQVENEAFLNSFGICPNSDKKFLEQEVSLVKSLDARQVIISASGELSPWYQEGQIGDVFATTLYRVVYNPWFGYFRYPLPAKFYDFKAKSSGIDPSQSLVIELQTEPWVNRGEITDMSSKDINKSMSINQFKANLQYAINTNFKQTYLWGVEWWYWQKLQGQTDYWDLAKYIFKR